MRLPIVAGNWKLNGSRDSVKSLAREVADANHEGVEVIVCPVALHIADVAGVTANTQIKLGAQNAAASESGAFTGEVSSTMLAEFGCSHVIIGHSERRSLFGDSERDCAERFKAVQNAGLTPIFCVGESLADREADNTVAVVESQLKPVFDLIGSNAFVGAVIAYEPVWAIGTGKTATPEQAQEIHEAIRGMVAVNDADSADALRILYGGSVNAGNACELFSKADIDGGLIGGAALKSADFNAISAAAAKQYNKV